jgi:DNA repair protein RadC
LLIKKSFTVRDLPPEERPRERLQKVGAGNLSDQELLALILGRGTAGESVLETARKLLTGFGSLHNLAAASIEDLSGVKGIGLAKAAQIKAAFELADRLNEKLKAGEKVECKNPGDVAGYMSVKLRGKKEEHFVTVLLDTRNRLLKTVEISVGSLDTSLAHPREVFKEAISASAASIIIVHNHPSGDCTPSSDDIELTKRLHEAGEIIGINVLDHIIVGDSGYVSLKAKGLF